ncbi:MAG: hypothetical protein ACQEXJ_10935 [Myxococcota bacterium]
MFRCAGAARPIARAFTWRCLGHRRWILDPFLDRISIGSAHGPPRVPTRWPAAEVVVLKVHHDDPPDLTGTGVDFIAYPRGHYPAELFAPGWFASLSVLSNPSVRWRNDDVDYSNAAITVTPEDGDPAEVTGVDHDRRGFGLPNVLMWRLETVRTGVRYQVIVDGVRVGGRPVASATGSASSRTDGTPGRSTPRRQESCRLRSPRPERKRGRSTRGGEAPTCSPPLPRPGPRGMLEAYLDAHREDLGEWR